MTRLRILKILKPCTEHTHSTIYIPLNRIESQEQIAFRLCAPRTNYSTGRAFALRNHHWNRYLSPMTIPRMLRGGGEHAREYALPDQKLKRAHKERARGGRRGGEGVGERGWEEGRPTYLCRIGTRDSAVPRKTTSPARCALARRPRSSARPWDCCCCSCGGCCSAGPASSASSLAGLHASGPAWSMARTFAYAASSTSSVSLRARSGTTDGFAPPRARARGT